jgi:hypothetical protein
MIDILAIDTGATQGVSIIVGIIGLGALIFAALRFGREDTKMLAGTATELVVGMQSVNTSIRQQRDEAMEREATARGREETAIRENMALRIEVGALRDEVRRLREAIENGGGGSSG